MYDLLGSGFFSDSGSRRVQGEYETSSASSISIRRRDEKETIERGVTHLLLIGMILGTRRRHYYRRSTESADIETTSVGPSTK